MEGAIGRHGDTDNDDKGWCLLQLCHNNALCIVNAFCQHRDVHKYSAHGAEIRWVNSHSLISTWYQLTFSVQCSTFVTKSAELSTGHHVLVCNLHWIGHQGLRKRAGPGDPTEQYGRLCRQGCNQVRWRPGQEASLPPQCSNLRSFESECNVGEESTCDIVGTFRRLLQAFGAPRNDSAPNGLCSTCPLVTSLFAVQKCKKDFCGHRSVLAPRTPGIHIGHGGGVAVVQISFSSSAARIMVKQPLLGWSKSWKILFQHESSLQGMTSELCWLCFAFATPWGAKAGALTVKKSKLQY